MKRDLFLVNPEAARLMKRLKVNFSHASEMRALAERETPALRFRARTVEDWKAWRRDMRGRLLAALGRTPAPVRPESRLVEEKDCGRYIRQLVVYRTTRDMWAPAYVLIPKIVLKARIKAPAVLAIHGHGYGAVDLVGLSPERRTGGNAHKDYAVQAAEQGLVALAPDLRNFGRRAVDPDQLKLIITKRGDPEAKFFRRDRCNVANLEANLLGYTLFGLQLHDLRAGLDYLSARPEVRADRIGACGLSTGGMSTLFLTALDLRVQAAVISGTLTSYRSYALAIETVCGSQLPHGILRFADLADVACLIAPRPVCFENGSADFGFLQKVARREFVRIRACYKLLGVPERAVFDAFRGGHEWHGTIGMPMLASWLTR